MSNHHYLSPARFSDLASAGLRVFPVRAGDKQPAVKWTEYKHRAPTPEELAAWDNSNYNVGVITGEASGILVLDVDSPEAQDFVDELNLPPTPAVRTGRGKHLYFKHPGFKVSNGTKIAGEKLDVRGDGGYVVGAGSIHSSGARYDWTISASEVEFAPLSEQLLDLIRNRKQPSKTHSDERADTSQLPVENGLDAYLVCELREAQAEIRAASEGARNDTLFKIAARLAGHISAAGGDWVSFSSALAESALAAGLDQREIEATLDSGWRAGSATPTPWIRVAGEHVYLSYQERFYHLESRTDLKPLGFNGQFGHLHRGKGTFANFLLSKDCIQKVHDLTYEPLNPARLIEREGRTWLNTFRPSDVLPAEGDPAPFVDFVTYLVPDESERGHLLNMIAFTVRYPGRKLRHALLLRSAAQGIGKTMLTEIWGELLGLHNVRKTTSAELSSPYQSYVPQHLLVVCEELNLGAGLKTYNDLKDLITADKVPVNEKYLRPRVWPVYANFVFLSNLNQPMLIEDSDRRIFYVDSPALKRERSFYEEFSAWWRENLGVIRHYLDTVDLSSFDPYAPPPVTSSKLALIAGSRSELAQEIGLAISEREGCFDRDIVSLDLVRSTLFRATAGKSDAQLRRALKELGGVPFGQQRVGASDRGSLWAIRNVGYWAFTDGVTRADEFRRPTGIFAGIEGPELDILHFSRWPADPALLFFGMIEEVERRLSK